MNVTEFLARLSYGPLSNLAIGNDGDGTVQEDKHPAVVSHLNEALLKLYTKYNLVQKELIIQQMTGIGMYELTSEHALSNVAGELLYIQDSLEYPYTNDLIKILGVFDISGERSLNDETDPRSVFTPSYNVLQVPNPVADQPIHVIYQAKHGPLIHTDLEDEIVLPDVLEAAAISYVAYKIYSNMNGQEHTAKAAEHLAAYNGTCAEVIDRDAVSSSTSSNGSKFVQRGFC